MSNLQQYQADISINTTTGESFTSIRGLARICGVNESTLRSWICARNITAKEAEILTPGGLQGARLMSENSIAEAIAKYNPTLAAQLMRLGVRSLMHKLAGYEVKSTAVQPMSQLQMIAYMATELDKTQERVARLELFAPIIDYYTLTAYLNLKPDAVKPTHYPSTGKALAKLSVEMNVEVKQVPDAKYNKVNTYHISVLDKYFNQ